MDSAFDFAAGLVQSDDGDRYRIPGTADHAEAACWLQNAADADGWTVTTQTFDGATYQALDAGAVSRYQACTGDQENHVAALQFTNIYATLDGPGDAHLMLAAHWDSKAGASDHGAVLGANDGASGVGILLALQRELDVLPFDVTVAFFDGEDGFEDCHPLAGSLWHARTQDPLPDAFVLLDMVGDDEARFPREARNDDGLQTLLWDTAQARGMEQFTNVSKSVVDDHVPFDEEGVPVVDIIDYARTGENSRFGFPWYWHTSQDTLDKLDPAFMDQMQTLLHDVIASDEFAALLE